MSNLIRDLRYALRGLSRTPTFTFAALAVIALGVGLNTAAFSLFDAVVLKPLPQVGSPAELVDIDDHGATWPSYVFLREETRAFSGVAAWARRWLSLAPGGSGSAERIQGTVVSGNYFQILDARPAAGRFFLPGEEGSGEAVAVVSHGLWQRRFSSSPAAVGTVLIINGTPFHVIGVAPAGFRGVAFGSVTDVWIPVGAWPRVATGSMSRLDYRTRNWGWMSMFGRLRPGVDLSHARTAVALAAAREQAAFPETVRGRKIELRRLASSAAGAGESMDPIRFLGLLLGSVVVVLVIACANLANLLLVRGADRRKEIAIRQAIGAGRSRLVRQLLTESLLLSAIGGVLGLFVATWAIALLPHIPAPGGMTLAGFGATLDLRVLAFAAAVALATGVLFGLVPALSASRVAVLPALKDEAPEGARRRRQSKSALVVAQLALSLVLLSCAGLFVRSLRNALATDLGFEARGVALASVQLGLARYDADRALRFARALEDRTAALPGVGSAVWTGSLPLSGEQNSETAHIDGTPPGARTDVDVQAVGPGYFSTLRIPMVSGREFSRELAAPAGPGSVVINESAARQFWPGVNPVGRRIMIYKADRTVVGVSRDSLFRSLRDGAVPMVAIDIEQLGGDGVLSVMTLLVRTSGDPAAVLGPIRAEAARLDPGLPVFGSRTLEEASADLLLPQQMGSALLGLFAAIAFLLAQIGVYAVVAGSVARRARELAIRLALGAHPGQMRRMVLRETATSIFAGIMIGLPLAALATRLLGGFLYGVQPTDPMTFAAAVLVIAAGGLLAGDLPARRAARVGPNEALRNE